MKTHSFVMLLARDLADHLATPLFIIDADGNLVYFNEAAEETLGQSFASTGSMPAGEWGTKWAPRDPTSMEAVDVADLPLEIARIKREPAQRELIIEKSTGEDVRINVVAFPLFDKARDFNGAAAIFWES